MCNIKMYEKILTLSKNVVKPALEEYVRYMIIRESFKHVLIEHVGLTNEEMLSRIEFDEKAEASTFYTIEDAEKYIKATLLDEYNQNDIAEWLLVSEEKSLKLLMPEDSFEGEFTGKKIKKGKTDFQMVESVAVIIGKDNSANGWHLITAYPEEFEY